MDKCKSKVPYVVRFKLPRRIVDREQYLLFACSGKRVLHVGCVNNASLGNWQENVFSEEWLHRKIEKVAREVVGIDNARETVELLRSRYNMDDIYVADAQHLENFDKGRFDVIIAGEVLQFLPSPGLFLNSAHSILREDGSLIVTTPNPFCLRKFLRVAFGIESIHVDHVSYFSHWTLKRLAETCGYRVVEQCNYRLPNRKPLLSYVLEHIACMISPNLCEGIICRMQSCR